jgi:hypothetical protein
VEYLEMDRELIGKGTEIQERYRCSAGSPHKQHTYSISTHPLLERKVLYNQRAIRLAR